MNEIGESQNKQTPSKLRQKQNIKQKDLIRLQDSSKSKLLNQSNCMISSRPQSRSKNLKDFTYCETNKENVSKHSQIRVKEQDLSIEEWKDQLESIQTQAARQKNEEEMKIRTLSFQLGKLKPVLTKNRKVKDNSFNQSRDITDKLQKYDSQNAFLNAVNNSIQSSIRNEVKKTDYSPQNNSPQTYKTQFLPQEFNSQFQRNVKKNKVRQQQIYMSNLFNNEKSNISSKANESSTMIQSQSMLVLKGQDEERYLIQDRTQKKQDTLNSIHQDREQKNIKKSNNRRSQMLNMTTLVEEYCITKNYKSGQGNQNLNSFENYNNQNQIKKSGFRNVYANQANEKLPLETLEKKTKQVIDKKKDIGGGKKIKLSQKKKKFQEFKEQAIEISKPDFSNTNVIHINQIHSKGPKIKSQIIDENYQIKENSVAQSQPKLTFKTLLPECNTEKQLAFTQNLNQGRDLTSIRNWNMRDQLVTNQKQNIKFISQQNSIKNLHSINSRNKLMRNQSICNNIILQDESFLDSVNHSSFKLDSHSKVVQLNKTNILKKEKLLNDSQNDTIQYSTIIKDGSAGKDLTSHDSNCYKNLFNWHDLKQEVQFQGIQNSLVNLGRFEQEMQVREKFFKQKFPMSPKFCLKQFGYLLNSFEKKEMLDYEEIYCIGIDANKNNFHGSEHQNYGYDDQEGNLKIIIKDHISYRYEILEILGKGSFGLVVKILDHQTKTYAALKIIKNNPKFHKQAQTEVQILLYMKQWDHQDQNNVVHIYDYFNFRSHLCITFQLLSFSLYQIIKNNQYSGFSIEVIRAFAAQILNALVFLGQHKIVHCDLKPENILLKEENLTNLKLVDFGSSCFETQRIYTYIQSRFYRAPEVILGLSYGTPIDM